jgi:hypothetical protein
MRNAASVSTATRKYMPLIPNDPPSAFNESANDGGGGGVRCGGEVPALDGAGDADFGDGIALVDMGADVAGATVPGAVPGVCPET